MHHGPLTKAVARGLKVLGERIAAAKIPPSKLDETINLATWNIRELGRRRRTPASLHYIAEVIGQFDLVAVVEVRDDVTQLRQVLDYLGPYWRVVFSDYLIDAGGNRERIAYVHDQRAVTFTGLASQAIAPRSKRDDEWVSKIGWWRAPYVASFRAGSFDFILITAHIRWDTKSKTLAGRERELKLLAEWVATKQKQKFVDDHDIIVMGDFNVPDVASPLFRAITSRGLKMPEALAGVHGSDLEKGKRYDQILHDPRYTKSFTGIGGVVDFYARDFRSLYGRAAASWNKLRFTFEMSDHLPLWMHVNTDTQAEKLDQILGQAEKRR